MGSVQFTKWTLGPLHPSYSCTLGQPSLFQHVRFPYFGLELPRFHVQRHSWDHRGTPSTYTLLPSRRQRGTELVVTEAVELHLHTSTETTD